VSGAEGEGSWLSLEDLFGEREGSQAEMGPAEGPGAEWLMEVYWVAAAMASASSEL
jgi:hypothetical protein